MHFSEKIKKIPSSIASRAKYDDLLYLFLQICAGSLAISAPMLAPVAIYVNAIHNIEKKYPKHKLKSSFYHFQRTGLISVESRGENTRVILTKEGEQKARLSAISRILSANTDHIGKEWDGRWRIIFFDLKTEKNKERDALRYMLKRCGFVLLQKSAWVYPHDCSGEIDFLRNFFRLKENEFRLILSDNIGGDNYLRKHFHLMAKI